MTDAQSPLALIRRITVGLLVVCLLVSLAIVWVASRRASPIDAQALASRLDAALPERAAARDRSLAVLPFASSDELEYLAFGLGDAIARELQRDPRLRISGRESAHSVVQTDLDMVDIGRVLNVAYVLRGTLASDGERLIVVATLWNTRRGEPRWEQRFDLAAGEFQMTARRIGRRVAEAIVPGGLSAATGSEPDVDPQAYYRYRRAVHLARRFNPPDLRKATELFDEALALEPDFAQAMVARVRAYSALNVITGEVELEFLAESAGAAIERLEALDPLHPDAAMLRLLVDLSPRAWVDKLQWLRQARERRPSDPTVLRWLAQSLAGGGYIHRAVETAREAAMLDPLSAACHELLATYYGVLGDDARMLEYAGLAEDLGIATAGYYRGFAALRSGAIDEGIAELRSGFEEAADFDFAWLDDLGAALEDPSLRTVAVRTLDAVDVEQRSHFMDDFMLYYALLGNVEKTLHALHARTAHAPFGPWNTYIWLPELRAARRDPRFGEVIAALELDRLWDAEGAPYFCQRPAAGGAYRCN